MRVLWRGGGGGTNTDVEMFGVQEQVLLRTCCRGASYTIERISDCPQSPRCQKKDWKEHKMNCSPLPVPLVPNVPERSPELISEVERAANMLKEVFDAWEVSSTVLHWASFNNVDTYSRGSTKRRSRRTFLTSRGSSSSSKIRRQNISFVSMATIVL